METEPLNILVISGSVRTDCTGRPVAAWAARAAAAVLPTADVCLVDLAEVELPPARELQGGGSAPTVLTDRIAAADAFVFVTPEYNAGYPAALKDAIDWHYDVWSFKAATIVSYGVVGGWRVNDQLRTVLSELAVVTARRTLGIAAPWNGIDGARYTPDPGTADAADAAFVELEWWARTLRAGRVATSVPS